ncbi:MAG: acyl-CoA synthetase FdrA [Betaproteobacteria bacterium]
MIANRVEKGRYLDSVALMRASRTLAALPGVEEAALMMGTPSNRELMRGANLLAGEGEAAGPNDLIIAVRGSGAQAAMETALSFLEEKEPRRGLQSARTLAGAAQMLPQANLALVSVPGAYAAHEARKALEAGLNVLVFSDNVPIEDEVALKKLAAQKGLLLMGPDCGTALIGGTPIAFANAVPRGDIGLVSASGTGLQEVSTLIARLGGGVSHGIGVGGRDLGERVGGMGTLAALELLEEDPHTKTIVLISKPPAPAVAKKILERTKKSAKPCVVCFLGSKEAGVVRTLTEAAEQAAGKVFEKAENKIQRASGSIRGLFCGGTLCSEAELIIGAEMGEFIDLGDDEYTRGKPHPMIEPDLRTPHLRAALADPKVGVVLVDVVLGFGGHENPAQVLVSALDRKKTLIASVTGTDADPQNRARQVEILRAAGVIVAESNARAAELAKAAVS